MPSPSSLYASAVAHYRAGRLAEAIATGEEILTLEPNHVAALTFLGQLAQQQGETARAESCFARALKLQPVAAPLHLLHAIALRALRRPVDAHAALARAVELDPTLAEAHHQIGNIAKSQGRISDALTALRTATRLAPERPPIWLNLGVAALEADARTEALAAFQRAVTLEPTRPETHNILGHTLAALGRTTEARAAFAEALRLRPNYAAAHDNLGRLAKSEGLLSEAISQFRAALTTQPAPGTHSNLLLALNFLPGLSPVDQLAEHRRWHSLYAVSLAPLAPSPAPASAADRRLRIGYLSPDFTHHAVAYFIEPVLAAHDRTRFEVFCYANVRVPDHVTARLRRQVEHWRDIAFLEDHAAAELIRDDSLDLLIDLAGHTAHHRLLVFARRPARVQATWIGYPNTTGLAAIDYRITDRVSDPVGLTEAFHSEKLVRLPTTFSCYRPDDDSPPVNALPAIEPGEITFGCFNSFAKLTPEVFSLWAQILTALPKARLLLKSRGLSDSTVAFRLHAVFSAAGITPDRITLNGEELSVSDHLALYHGVDVALDPFPYNGTTTTCEALWMGVPVITLAGCTHVARVGASLLTHTDLSDWIATTPDAYVQLAVATAHDLPRLRSLRSGLREQLRASPLCDAGKFTRGLEEAFASMVTRLA